MDIKSFLVRNTGEQKEVTFERFDEPFVIESISEAENDRLKKASTTKRISKSGNKITDLDTDKYGDLLLSRCVKAPDLENAELQEFYGTSGDKIGTLKAMLRAGEYSILSQQVLELNGFTETDEELKEEVKN